MYASEFKEQVDLHNERKQFKIIENKNYMQVLREAEMQAELIT